MVQVFFYTKNLMQIKLVKTCYFKCNFKGNGRKVKYSDICDILKRGKDVGMEKFTFTDFTCPKKGKFNMNST